MNNKILAAGAFLLFSLGACNQADKLTKNGDKLFRVKGEYQAAIDAYKKALEKGASKSYANAQIAESYRLSNRMAEAAPFYKAAIESGAKADSLLFQYPFALKASGNYAEAKKEFSTYIDNTSKEKRREWAVREVENLNKIEGISKKKTWYEITNVDAVNTASADFSPFVHEKDLIFSSSRSGKVYLGDGTPYSDLFKYKIGGAGPESVSSFNDQINMPGRHEASLAMTKDGKMIVFARSNDGKRKTHKEVCLYMSRADGNGWKEPELMTINDFDSWNGSPAFSSDGKTLYFSSNRKGGKGGLDLYKTTLDANGKWGKVTNLGESINTPGDEVFPYYSEDGKFYFSSDGQPSLGGLDIFVASKDKDKNTVVENLGIPINSTSDDFGLTLVNPVEGYFSSNRAGGKGSDDIYYFKDSKNELRIVKFNLKGVATGKDESTGATEILTNQVVKLLDAAGNPVAESTTDNDGKFAFQLEASKSYTILAERKDYFTKRDVVSTVGKSPSQDELTEKLTYIELDYPLVLEKLKQEKTFVLDNVYYDLDKADIRPDAAVELDKVVTILNDNPGISIELSSHTDDRGNDDYNLKLSQKRAEAAVNYIVSKGISASRMNAKGYGETKPLIENATTDEDYQKNRRTEFKVIKIQ